jgi:hypothetical protein
MANSSNEVWQFVTVLLNSSNNDNERHLAPVAFVLQTTAASSSCMVIAPMTFAAIGLPLTTWNDAEYNGILENVGIYAYIEHLPASINVHPVILKIQARMMVPFADRALKRWFCPVV